jgi:hypothetical protein
MARFVISSGDADGFDVLEGRKLNSEPLNLFDANRLAKRASASDRTVAGQLVDDFDRRRRREAADTTGRRFQ